MSRILFVYFISHLFQKVVSFYRFYYSIHYMTQRSKALMSLFVCVLEISYTRRHRGLAHTSHSIYVQIHIVYICLHLLRNLWFSSLVWNKAKTSFAIFVFAFEILDLQTYAGLNVCSGKNRTLAEENYIYTFYPIQWLLRSHKHIPNGY